MDVATILQNVLGCKWTLHILAEVRSGVNRPGDLVRSADGLTTKVLNERLVKLVRFGILQKTSFPEVPPRVEYELTDFGKRFSRLLDEVDRLQAEG
ncbi:Helix-turn-helix, HxlR type domain protein [Rhodopirellula sp. SWK7]|nr:Helix-turn-helix, HxlR type domain protein [Rhodopirellula sp. SWK7]